MAEIKRPRRLYLHKRQEARKNRNDAEGIWRAKQEAEPGTPVSADFPLRSELAALGYTTNEDLDGADEHELRRVGLTANDAAKVMAALAALT